MITENDIKNLPEVVQRYLRYVGIMGQEKVNNLRTLTQINMNLGAGRGWTIMTAEEYNFFDSNPESPEGDDCYGRLTLKEIEYNLKAAKD